jgi:hypothetical protein
MRAVHQHNARVLLSSRSHLGGAPLNTPAHFGLHRSRIAFRTDQHFVDRAETFPLRERVNFDPLQIQRERIRFHKLSAEGCSQSAFLRLFVDTIVMLLA